MKVSDESEYAEKRNLAGEGGKGKRVDLSNKHTDKLQFIDLR
jgi:hypothetical protein